MMTTKVRYNCRTVQDDDNQFLTIQTGNTKLLTRQLFEKPRSGAGSKYGVCESQNHLKSIFPEAKDLPRHSLPKSSKEKFSSCNI